MTIEIDLLSTGLNNFCLCSLQKSKYEKNWSLFDEGRFFSRLLKDRQFIEGMSKLSISFLTEFLLIQKSFFKRISLCRRLLFGCRGKFTSITEHTSITKRKKVWLLRCSVIENAVLAFRKPNLRLSSYYCIRYTRQTFFLIPEI